MRANSIGGEGPSLQKLRRRVGELVEELTSGLLEAITKASAAEIATLLETPGVLPTPFDPRKYATGARERSTLPRPAGAERSTLTELRGSRNGFRSDGPDTNRDSGPAHGQSDAFDITSPGELLASTQETQTKAPSTGVLAEGTRSHASPSGRGVAEGLLGLEEVAEPRVARPAASQSVSAHDSPAAPESSVALPGKDQQADSERRPRIVLREGERLLSATGSGVVIRRERRVSPPR